LIVTTVNSPTEAIELFAKIPDWQVVVVGDKKTPAYWNVDGVTYLSCGLQQQYGFDLPWNNYVRKMIGYLHAIRNGADLIAETDDDNIPGSKWGFPAGGMCDCISGEGFINIYKFFTDLPIWARGLPLHTIRQDIKFTKTLAAEESVGIWQGLADNDPDVDAIYRLTNGVECIFKKRPPLVLGKNAVSPFNSQNTLFKKSVFPLLYLPVTVNQRFADILRGYVAQPIMWIADYLLGFTEATVVQERNAHDLMKDFDDEIPCYTLSEKAFQIVRSAVRSKTSIPDNLMIAYEALAIANIVQKSEIEYLARWLELIGESDGNKE